MDTALRVVADNTARKPEPPCPHPVRCAVRFPLRLAVDVFTEAGRYQAMSKNVSASGILLDVPVMFPVSAPIAFSLHMPAAALGVARNVAVHCEGRVVRSFESPSGFHAAATIDKYCISDEE